MVKSVLVTGAAGFLGSHLCRHHLDQGDYVLGVDNFCSSEQDSLHFKDLLADDRFDFLEQDVVETTFSTRRWPAFKPEIIYNFACPASPPVYQMMPVETMMTCVVGTANVLQFAQRTGAIVVHASTSEVYGDPDITPQHEKYRGQVNSYGPRSCYDEGKRAAEALCYDFRHKHGVDARMVRIFNTYGPNMDPYDGRVISNFICQALRGEDLTVYGDGMQGRSFCYVDDLIRGIVALGGLQLNPETPINLGNPQEFRVWELAVKVNDAIRPQPTTADVKELQRRALSAISNVSWKSMPVDDPRQRCPDINLARMYLDWEPRVTLDEGLSKTIAYFQNVANSRPTVLFGP
jgi:UDP-glucuronate decarboxylase